MVCGCWKNCRVCDRNSMVFIILISVGPLADTQALQQSFQDQHKHVEKLCADYTAKLRTARVRYHGWLD